MIRDLKKASYSGLAHVGSHALPVCHDAQRFRQPFGVRQRDPQQHVASLGVLGGDEALHVGPFLRVDFKGSVALLPLVVDDHGPEGKAALFEDGDPFFVVGLGGKLVGRLPRRDGFNRLLRPAAKYRQVVPARIVICGRRGKAALAEPGRVFGQGVERVVGKGERELRRCRSRHRWLCSPGSRRRTRLRHNGSRCIPGRGTGIRRV